MVDDHTSSYPTKYPNTYSSPLLSTPLRLFLFCAHTAPPVEQANTTVLVRVPRMIARVARINGRTKYPNTYSYPLLSTPTAQHRYSIPKSALTCRERSAKNPYCPSVRPCLLVLLILNRSAVGDIFSLRYVGGWCRGRPTHARPHNTAHGSGGHSHFNFEHRA